MEEPCEPSSPSAHDKRSSAIEAAVADARSRRRLAIGGSATLVGVCGLLIALYVQIIVEGQQQYDLGQTAILRGVLGVFAVQAAVICCIVSRSRSMPTWLRVVGAAVVCGAVCGLVAHAFS